MTAFHGSGSARSTNSSEWLENTRYSPRLSTKWPNLFSHRKRWLRLGKFEAGQQYVEYATDEERARIALEEEFGDGSAGRT